MVIQKGEQLWKLRKTHGKPRKFKTQGELWRAACRYFQWCEDNPLYEQTLVTNRGDWEKVDLEKPRAMTFEGLYLHINLSKTAFLDYRKRPEFSGVCKSIETVMREQKFTGAASGLFNPLIIARDLGLKDQSEITGPEGGPIQTRSLDKDEYAEIRQKMLDADDC